jgi:hypothetical protein
MVTRWFLAGTLVLAGAAHADTLTHCQQRALSIVFASPSQTDADRTAKACLCSDDQVDVADAWPLQRLSEKLAFAQICLADTRSQLLPQSWAIRMCGCVTDKVSTWVREHQVTTFVVHPPKGSAQGQEYLRADKECAREFPRPDGHRA